MHQMTPMTRIERLRDRIQETESAIQGWKDNIEEHSYLLTFLKIRLKDSVEEYNKEKGAL